MTRLYFLLALVFATLLNSVAQRPADTMTGIFDERIRTLRLSVGQDLFAPPVIMLGSDDRLLVSFDCLEEDREFFRYSLEHCNANWSPSGLVESEFLDGFNEGTIEDYDFSRGTTVHYVHYSFAIPNEQISPKLSGNYLLRVYREDDPDTTVFQCRFMICEGTTAVGAVVTSQTDIDYNATHQQVELTVDVEGADVEDPFNDLQVFVQQNGRLDSEVSLRQPLRMQGTKAVFEHRPQLIFEAGNEYRRMEFLSDKYPGMGIDEISYFAPYYHYKVNVAEPRNEESYSYDQTQHGRFFIREYNSTEPDTEADYGVVHFSLEMPEMPGYMFFLDGDFVQRRFDDNSRLVFNTATGLYERSLMLKQGAYNYQILAVPPGARRGYTNVVEGDKYQTGNEYLIKVYHRRRGERYDRLIGVGGCFTNQ